MKTPKFTHQGIADRIVAMNQEASAVYNTAKESQSAELKQLRAECAGIGHIYVHAYFGAFGRTCAACGVKEPIPKGTFA